MLDASGKLLLSGYDDLTTEYGDYMLACKNKRYGLQNARGEPIIPMEYDCLSFRDFPYLYAEKGNEKYYMDVSGRIYRP